MNTKQNMTHFMSGLKRRNPSEREFHQAVHEVAYDILPYIEAIQNIKMRYCWRDLQSLTASLVFVSVG